MNDEETVVSVKILTNFNVGIGIGIVGVGVSSELSDEKKSRKLHAAYVIY